VVPRREANMQPCKFAAFFSGGQGFSPDITPARLVGFSFWGQLISVSYSLERS
jgi:hypothetical protein